MGFFPEMLVSGTGLSAERIRQEVIARNIANANTTRTETGGAFRRQLVSIMSVEGDGLEGTPGGVRVAGITADPAPLRQVFEPGHPDANAEGYVEKPNVDIMLEMVDMLGATRAYEANVTALQSAKDMARRALEI